MQVGNRESFRIGDWQVEPGLNLISRDGRALSLRPRVMDLLVYLCVRAGEVVSVDEIIDQVWGGVFVTHGAIYNCINELRAAFEDHASTHKHIKTISKRGYRVVAPVVFANADEVAVEPPGRPQIGRRAQVLGSLLIAVIAAIIFLAVQIREPSAVRNSRILPGSIAILPFKDLNADDGQEYFADGITEELLNSLAGVEGFRVAARTSSFYFKDKNPSVADVRQALGVAHILEGSIRRNGNRVRITAQLIDSSTGFHLWSETYDRELVDIFAIEDEISMAIVGALRDKLDLTPSEMGPPRAARVVDPEAYTEYLFGRHYMNQRTPEAFEQAVGHFKRALAIDGSHAPSQTNLAISYGLLSGYGAMPREKAHELAKPHADRAIELDAELAEAHGAQYFMEFLQNIHDPEFVHLNRAIALNPSYMDARNWKANELDWQQQHRKALVFREINHRIDPLSIINNINLAAVLLQVGRREEAAVIADRLMLVDMGWGQRITGNIAYDRGDIPTAIEAYLIGLKNTPGHGPLLAGLAITLSELGLGEDARLLLPRPLWSHFNAKMEGDWEAALKFARQGFEAGGDNVFFLPALAGALYFNRDYEGARTKYEQLFASAMEPSFPPGDSENLERICYAATLRALGNEQKAGEVFEKALSNLHSLAAAGYMDGYFLQSMGLALVYQGRFDDALDSFEQAFAAGNRQAWDLSGPLLDPLRDDPRFLALRAKYDSARRENRAAVLALICSDDLRGMDWQPLPETCGERAAAGRSGAGSH